MEYDDPNHTSVWLWRRPQIGYHLVDFAAERSRKRRLMATCVASASPIVILREGAPDVEAKDGHLLRVRELARDPVPFHSRGEACRKQGDHEEALASYRAALAIDPEFAPAHAGLGNALYHLERYEDAHESLTRALSLKPDPAYAGSLWRLTGRAAQALGRPEEAARHYDRALELDPRDAEAVDLLAMLRFREQRYALALGWYRKLTEISPESARSHANLGVTLYHPDRIDEAIRSFGDW